MVAKNYMHVMMQTLSTRDSDVDQSIRVKLGLYYAITNNSEFTPGDYTMYPIGSIQSAYLRAKQMGVILVDHTIAVYNKNI